MGPSSRLDRSAGVNWQSLSHGIPGLVLAFALTLAGLLAALNQRRVPLRGLLWAPVVAIPTTVGAALVGLVLTWLLPARVTSSAWADTIMGIGVLMFVGYATGMYLTRQRDARDAHKRGTVLIPVQRPTPASAGQRRQRDARGRRDSAAG
jgi:hypothetical protein